MAYKDYPNQYQMYTFDANNKLMHAGPTNAPRLSAKFAVKHERKWLQWRREYIKNNPGDYPLSNTAHEYPHMICMENIETNKRIYVKYE